MSSARDNYSEFSLDPHFSGRKILIPKNNYLSGEMISRTYTGPGWYVPHKRDWHIYSNHKCLPNETDRDAIDFQSQKEFVEFLRRRDFPKAPLFPAYIPSTKFPRFNVYGHRLDCTKEKIPERFDALSYMGCYHELYDRHMNGDFKSIAALEGPPQK